MLTSCIARVNFNQHDVFKSDLKFTCTDPEGVGHGIRTPLNNHKNIGFLSPYLTGLRLFCDSWRQTSRVGRKAVSKKSPVIRNFLACVAKWRKVVAKILNMFKNFMRQNSLQNGRKVIAGVSKPSRTCRPPLVIYSQSFLNRTYLRDN